MQNFVIVFFFANINVFLKEKKTFQFFYFDVFCKKKLFLGWGKFLKIRKFGIFFSKLKKSIKITILENLAQPWIFPKKIEFCWKFWF